MHQLTVGQFKTQFSEVLQKVQNGESIGITYGKNKKKVAALIPYKELRQKAFTLGLLKGKASVTITDNFTMTDEEFLQS